MSDAFAHEAVRTPFGRFGKGLAGARPDDLAAHVVRTLVRRAPALDPARIDDVPFGDADGAGDDNRDVARMAVLLAGPPTSVTGTTVNRLCGSSLDAAKPASRAGETGDASPTLVGGVESMSRAPWVLPKPSPAGHETLHSTTLGWRLVNPDMPDRWTISPGESTEKLAELAREEGIRSDTSVEALAQLPPAFARDGTVTAGNASPLSAGAGALSVGDEAAGTLLGQDPLARIAGRGAAGVDPGVFGIGPVEAAERALARAGIGWGDLAAVELDEAFAGQSLACLKLWPESDLELVDVCGGAIAIWHPLGASGTRILGTLARELQACGGGWGLAAICIGIGQGLAVVLRA